LAKFGEKVVPHLLEEFAAAADEPTKRKQLFLICHMLGKTARPALSYLREMLEEAADDDKRQEELRDLIQRVEAE